MNFPPRAGRVSGRATPSLRHAPRAKLQRTNPGSSPLSLRGILFRGSGLALLLMPLDYPTWLDELLKRLGATLVPIALVSVGYQLQLSLVQGRALALTVGLLFKLV